MANLNSNELLNKGCFPLYCNHPVPKDSTFLIIGQARAGTSMVSKLLTELGVCMGEEMGPVYEDNELGLFVKDLSNGIIPNGFREGIFNRDNCYHKWGWKRPDLYSFIDVVLPIIRNPRIICCLRDVVAIAARNKIALNSSFGKKDTNSLMLLNEALAAQKVILEKINSLKVPTLLISYEKAFSLPESFLFSLTQFVGINLSLDKLARLTNLIQPNHFGYSLRARENPFNYISSNLGILKNIEGNFLKATFNTKCSLKYAELWRDGVKVSTVKLVKKSDSDFQVMSIEMSPFKTKESHFFELKFEDGSNFMNSPYFWTDKI
jgi:hypothetical protein